MARSGQGLNRHSREGGYPAFARGDLKNGIKIIQPPMNADKVKGLTVQYRRSSASIGGQVVSICL
jgi:hypothetical protein